MTMRPQRAPAFATIITLAAAACSDATTSGASTTDAATIADGGSARDAITEASSGDASKDAATDVAEVAIDAAIDAATDASLTTGARIAIPMYVDPSSSPTLWTQAYAAGGTVGLLVANPDNGPGASVDGQYTNVVTSAHAAGELVIGYVHSTQATRPIADVEADVDAWYAFYPALDGIFVDEVASDASTVASYYAPLYAHIKAKSAKVTVAINPGTMVDEAFMSASDILVVFEDTYVHFLDPTQNPPNPAWVATYPASRFWTLILSASATDEAAAIAGARARHSGWIYVTAEGPDTAYQAIETGAYWSAELTDVSAP